MNRIGLIILLISSCFLFSYQKYYSHDATCFQDKWLTHEEEVYSFTYPADWELDKSKQMGTEFILFSPLVSDQDQFRENVNFITQDLTGYSMDIDKYAALTVSQIERMITDGKLLESLKVKGDVYDYQKIIYSGKQGIYDLKFEQYLWVVNDRAFVLTLTCEADQYSTYVNTGEKILNNFELKLN